jgi:two-component system sensor histidine kinase QseC
MSDQPSGGVARHCTGADQAAVASTSQALVPGRSLQARLLVTVLGLMGVVWLAVLASTWYGTQHELNELLDAHLSQAAALLATRQLDDIEREDFPVPPTLHKYQTRVAIQIWHEGRLVVRSSNAPTQPLATFGALGLSHGQVAGQGWRVFTAQGREPDVLIHVGELESARRHILATSLRSSAWPVLLALPLLALGVWWAVRGAMRPLHDLGRAVAARSPQALDMLPLAAAPPEVAPLLQALNGLFARMAELLESERRFTADAAHELRTPIAAIRMQAQVAQGARTPDEGALALAATLEGCDRATRLVEQLLQLARLEAQACAALELDAPPAQTDLSQVARELLADWAPHALARRQTLALALEPAGPIHVPMPTALAQVLLRNLIDNALRYSPDGATVQVTVQAATAGRPATLTVEDSGPGLPPPALARLGERFYRVLGSGQSGSGLGWSIVRRLARLYSLSVELGHSPALGGLRVTVIWRGADHRCRY